MDAPHLRQEGTDRISLRSLLSDLPTAGVDLDPAAPTAPRSVDLGRAGRLALVACVLGGLYALGALLPFWFLTSPQSGAAFFPAAGLTLAVLVLSSRRTWPLWLAVVAVAELVVDLTHGQSAGMAVGFALANVVEPLVGATVLIWASHRMTTMRGQVFGYVVAAVAFAPVFGAILGATTAVAIGGATGGLSIAGKWWLGDALGVLVVATPILAWSRPAHLHNECPPVEAVAITLVATGVTILPALLWEHPMLYAVLPVLIWAAFRGGVRAVSLAGVGVAFAADWAAVTGRASDLIARGTPGEQLLLVQLFLGVTLLAALTLAVEVAERRRAERAERRAEAELIRTELASANAADLERRRIAQETHDIVGHALNVMLLQAGAARRVIDEDVDRSRQLLESLEDVGRHAFNDLDIALGLADETPDGVANLGLSSVPALVDVMRRAGMSVDLVIDGDEGRFPSTLVDWSAFRIIQEALTNAAKHAPGAHTTVEVRYEPDAVVISVVDDGAGPMRGRSASPGSGRGLIGMRERVAVIGGHIRIGPNGGAGFEVRARLPVPKKS